MRPASELDSVMEFDFYAASARGLGTSISFDPVIAANTLTLQIKMPATVTVYTGHCRTLYFLPGIISLIIMCLGIIRPVK